MVRVDIETIVMSAGPVPSIIVLRERGGATSSDTPQRALSIQTGSFEAASVGRGVEGTVGNRPVTHELFVNVLSELGCKLERVEITRVDGAVFYATLVLLDASGDEKRVDARPSDALALAVRVSAPVYVEDDVMNRAGTVSAKERERDSEEEIRRFDEFVQTLSPNDF